ncbi:hypothetical protein ACOMHN_051173 [Nucella lapillus]
MDFVDLDKVLDQFEEEEKAAEEILPGREVKPSGYAEYLVNQQDRPWENLSLGQPLDPNSKQALFTSQPVAYDDPYDSTDKPATLDSHTDLKQLSFPTKHSFTDPQDGGHTPSPSITLDQELALSKLKEEKIEAYLPPLSLSNGVGEGSEVNGERELLSYPLPKSDILVEGHGQTPTPTLTPPPSPQPSPAPPCTELSPQQSPTPLCHPAGTEPTPEGPPAEPTLEEPTPQGPPSESTLEGPPSEPTPQGPPSERTPEGPPPEPGTNYASPNSPATTMPVVSPECGLSQETRDLNPDQLSAEAQESSPDHPAVEEIAAVADSTDAGSCGEMDMSENEPSDTSLAGQPDGPTDASLQHEGGGGDGRWAVGFESEECEMDKDEVDAYLAELESSIVNDGGDMSRPSAVCEAETVVGCGGSEDVSATTDAVIHSTDHDGSGQSPDSTRAVDHRSPVEGVATHGDPTHRVSAIITQHQSNTVSMAGTQHQTVTQHHTVNGDVAHLPTDPEGSAGVKVGDPASTTSDLWHHHGDHPDVVTDLGGQPEAGDQDGEGSVETEEQGAVVSTEDGDGSAAKPPLGVSNVSGKTEGNLGRNLTTRLVDSASLQFPVAGNKNGVNSVVKGKLEIEGLLDEIVSARLAQKSELITAAPASHEQLSADLTMPKERDHYRTEGWGPQGSMVCSLSREPSSAGSDLISPPDSGTPSPNLGIGARPKDPSQLKKNRPNSLLGLSKISLTSPFSPPQHAGGPVVEVVLPAAQHAPGDLSDPGRERTQNARVLGGVSPPPSGVSPPEGGAVIPADGAPSMDDEDEDSPVLRHPEGRVEGEEASSGSYRSQSWGPSTLSSPPPQRTKRPTSLNLPVRQDRMGSLSPDAETARPRKAGVVAESAGSSEAGSSEEESMGIGGTDGGVYEDMGGGDPHQEGEGAGAAAMDPTHPSSILHLNLGKIAPTWLPDADAPACMECAARFTFTKRRHHCRACGKIFCSTCCGQKSRLTYLENKDGRVCVSCHHILSSAVGAQGARQAGVSCRSPNPNNPIEYCSTVPPAQQASARTPPPTVLVPTGVLKRHGSNRRSEPKQVMFSDGIRPGGDLTELDGSDQGRIPPRRSARAQKKVEKQQGEHSSAKTRRLRGSDSLRNPCLIPDDGLPPIVVHTDDKGEVSLSENPDPALLMAQIRNDEASPVVFAINLNLFVLVKIMNLDCCLKRVVWCFTTQGMVTAGQEELVIVLETLPEEETVPRDIFCHFSTVYEEAGRGNTVSHMGHTIFNQPFLDSSTHGGFLYLRATFQCTNKLLLPPAPFLFPILLHKWETPWAKVFPIRLMLRLGAEHRYYPCPLVSIRNRKPVFFEIGHTIMNLLADFRNFQYMLQQIRGVHIHMGDQKTFINFPRNRYQEVMKVVGSSNEHVMALGASFSLEADSHLVCIQNEDGNYQTQAINIQNKPRQVTGASFVVFNGALKSSSGLRAKSSIVEDGLMVQILPEVMGALKQSLKDMQDFAIPCGALALTQPEEVVTLRWVDEDKALNVGVKSPVDGLSLEGVESVPVLKATDYVGDRLAIRWTQLYLVQMETGTSRWEPLDLSRVAETLSTAVCIALTPHLQKLREARLTKIGLRVTLQPDSVGYEVGSNGERLPDFYINDLDNALIPVIHSAITSSQDGPIVLELLLHVIH